jgi:DNA-binding IclR family transcriptional regulator
MAKSKQADKNYIAVMGKIFSVLERFVESSDKREPVAFTQISKELPFTRTTVHRILYSLEKLGYVEKANGAAGYRLAQKFFELTGLAADLRQLKAVSKSAMHNLLMRHGETVNLGVLDSGFVVHIEVLESPSALRISAFSGQRNPVHSTALGKAMLAFLPEQQIKRVLNEHRLVRMTPNTITQQTQLIEHLASVREQGVALDMEENFAGVTCVAAPIFDQTGRPMAAFSVSGPTSRMTTKLKAITNDLRTAARAVTGMLRPIARQGLSAKATSTPPRV